MGVVTKSKWMTYDYKLDYSGTIFVYGGRAVIRSTDQLVYCTYCTMDNGYFLPVIVSAYSEAVASTMGGIYSPGPNVTLEIDGATIYGLIASNNSTKANDSSGYNRRFFGEVGSPDGAALVTKLYNEIKMLGYSLYE